jgi:hypothetical protein
MLESWFLAALLITVIVGVLTRFVQPEGRDWLRWYLHILRRPRQALHEWTWSLVSMVIATVLRFWLYLIPLVAIGLVVTLEHVPPMLVPGCFWPSMGLPLLAVVSLVRELRKTRTTRTEPPAPGRVATEPNP